MIFTMRGNADFVEFIGKLKAMDCDVQVKPANGAPVKIAAFGPSVQALSSLEIKRLGGVKSFTRDNGDFVETNGKDYVEAWLFLSQQGPEKAAR